MEKVMTKGFCELNEQEMNEIEGGCDAKQWLTGCAQVIGGGVALAVGGIVCVSTYGACGEQLALPAAAGFYYGMQNIENSFYN